MVSGFIDVLIGNIAPIFLVAAAGYILRNRLGIDKGTLSKLTLYAFSPALIFDSLANAELPGEELWRLALFTLAAVFLSGALALAFSLLFRLAREDTIAFMLVMMFVNGGNYGLTLNSLRYGEEGLARASVYFVVSTAVVYTVGVYIASMGRSNWTASLSSLLRLPAFYAVILAIIVYRSSWQVPPPVMRGIEVAGEGAIPVMLVVLGMQIADLKSLEGLRMALPISILRLLLGPIIAIAAAGWLALSGVTRSAAILEASMPTAVITTILATEYDVKPGLITTVVVLSTLMSALTLPAIIVLLEL